jgi:hypothetical protein
VRRLSLPAVIASFLPFSVSALVLGQELTATEVMKRAHAYIVEYEDDLSGIVAEEFWRQRIVRPGGTVESERVLRSDYLVYQLLPEEQWFAFRDVFEVDGEPVRNRDEQFRELFARGAMSIAEQEAKNAAASAQYNLGAVYRTIDRPTFVLAFLRPAYRSHFVFERVGEEVVNGTATWVMSYREIKEPTFIRSRTGKSLKSHGRLWIEPTTGRLVRSELVTGATRAVPERATIVVTFGPTPGLPFWVPIEMSEVYDNPRKRAVNQITGLATYSNFRPSGLRKRLSTPD